MASRRSSPPAASGRTGASPRLLGSGGPREGEWKADPHRVALLALYAETDALLAPFTCDASTECCQFGVTGREPYPTAAEVRELAHAARGLTLGKRDGKRENDRGSGRGRALPVVDSTGRCPMLGDDGRCRVYAARPFGCRTFFCERVEGPGKLPRSEIQRLGRAIADLSARVDPRDPHARPLTNALEELARRRAR